MQFLPLPIRPSMRAATERRFRLGRDLSEQMRLDLIEKNCSDPGPRASRHASASP
jgi:hypothetical protein